MKLPEFFGLDIGNHSIKVAKIDHHGSKATLTNVGSIDTPFGVIESVDPASVARLGDAINEVRKSAGINTNKVVAALPESVIFSRVMEVPDSSDEGKIEETIYWEAKQQIPIPVEEVQLDWIPIQSKESMGAKLKQILLVAAPKKMVEQYQNLCDVAGLELIALETESIATARTISFNRKFDKPVLVLDFGANGTDMSVIKDNKLIFAQSLGTGSDSLTRAIASDYGISEQQAEQYKRTYGLLKNQGDGKIAAALTPVMEIIVNEINKTVNFFKAHLSEGTPNLIYFVGDGAKLLGLSEYMQERLGITTEITDPLMNIDIPGKVKKEIEQMNTVGFSVAVGLALKTE